MDKKGNRNEPNWAPFFIGGTVLEGIGFFVLILAVTSNEEKTPAAMLAVGIALLSLGGLLSFLGIMKTAAAKKERTPSDR